MIVKRLGFLKKLIMLRLNQVEMIIFSTRTCDGTLNAGSLARSKVRYARFSQGWIVRLLSMRSIFILSASVLRLNLERLWNQPRITPD